MANNGPTPPSPRHIMKRFKFFAKHQHDYPPDKIKSECQRFANTSIGQEYIKKIKEADKQPKELSDLKG